MSCRTLYCRCAYALVVPPQTKDAVLDGLAASGEPFEAVADLCEMAARRDPALRRLAAAPDLRIAACYPRAVRALFHAAGAPLAASGVVIRNMRVETAEEVLRGLADGRESPAEAAAAPPSRPEGGP
jgi:hypothetical protein